MSNLNAEGNPVKNSNSHRLLKTLSPRVELPYTYLMAWYVMHCPSLMITVSASEGFVRFVQWLESSRWLQYYMFYIRKTILNGANYHLDRCLPEIHDASYRDKFANLVAPMDSPDYHLASSGG